MDLVLAGRRPLAEAAFLALESGGDSLLIDASQLEFAGPFELAGMVATARWAASGHLPVTLKMPTNIDAATYLQRMNVLMQMPARTQVVGRVPPDTRKDAETLLEVTHVTQETADEVCGRLGRLVTSFYEGFSVRAGHVVFRACGELVANAVEHGAGPVGAFLAVQTYSGTTTGAPRLEFAICDTGIGVMNHLRKNKNYAHFTRDELAITKAMETGVSGVSDDERGNGLSDLLEHTREHGEIEFQIRSGKGQVKVTGSPSGHSQVPGSRHDQTSGTWAWLTHRIPIDQSDYGSIGKMKPEK